MRSMKYFLTLLALLLVPWLMYAQLTGQVNGTVTDQSGAVLPNASVSLQDTGTGVTLTQTTNAAGAFAFSAIKPGTYKVTVSASGFKNYVVPALQVSVAQSNTLNPRLQVGAVSEIVEVTSTGQELQTTDASVGNVINFRAMQGLPSLTRDATALLQIQPMAIPSYSGPNGSGAGDITSGQVSGARSDQNTFNVDGGDATSTCEGDNNYVSNSGSPQGVVPTPVESLDEFRVVTNNSVTFARSAGAEVQLVTKRGGNAFHGALYEYNQNTLYNANTWQNNHRNANRPVWKDNRFGGRLGGPILKDHAYFFLMYEGERQSQGYNYYRQVPSANMRNGILTFNINGVPTQFNFATGAPTAVCGSGPCDPRGLGMSPAIKQIWSQLPAGNNTSEGDGVNIIGFDYSAPTSTKLNQGIARLDFKLSDKWDLMTSGRYATTEQTTAKQVLVNADGTAKAVFGFPIQPRLYVAGLTGRLTNNLTNNFHFSFLRQWWGWNPMQPSPQLSTLGQTLQINGEANDTALGMVPLNVDTQNARTRVWSGKNLNFNNELTWLRGKHVFTMGGTFLRQNILHVRNDKVSGGLSIPEAYVFYSSSYMAISENGYVPDGLSTGDVSNWDNQVADVLGLVNHSSQVLTRKGDFSPNAPGTYITANAIVKWYDLHASDTWRIWPTFTLTYGLDWGLQTPPYEVNGLQTMMQYSSNGQTAGIHGYLNNLANAAAQGQFYVPQLQFAAIKSTGQKYPYNMDWHNFAPRLAFAWSPAAEGGLLGKILGNQKTSIRAGYGRYFDRQNGVGLIMTPALGIGFLNLSQCNSPNITVPGFCSSPTADVTDPSNAFRIGVDGNGLPIPPLSTVTGNAIIPGVNSPYEGSDQRIDPFKKTGVEDTWTLNIQRQLNDKTLLEVGYVGRVAHHLYSTYDTNAVPYMFKLNGQTFADAYDKVMVDSNFGNKTSASGYVPPAQPFFEALGGTASIYNGNRTYFRTADVTSLWDTIMFDVAPGNVTLPMDSQFGVNGQQITSGTGSSNYNGVYISLREQAFRGFTFQTNYTWSHSFDNVGFGQQWTVITNTDQFNPRKDYVSSYFDMRHVINGFMVYDLPFGPQHRFSGPGWLNKLIGGWQVTSALQASSGIPEAIYGYSCAEMGSGYSGNCAAMVTTTGKKLKQSVHYLPDGTLELFPAASGAAAQALIKANYRVPIISDQHLSGDLNRGMNRWNMDASLNKTTKITERVSFGLSLQVMNVFNHPEFGDSGSGLFSSATNFGKSSGRQWNNPRWLNIGARIDF